MMHGRGKSDPAIVAGKPANKVEPSTAEPVEPRAGTEGNAGQQRDAEPGRRVTGAGTHTANICRLDPR
jgi:RNA-directed DNA polymerase